MEWSFWLGMTLAAAVAQLWLLVQWCSALYTLHEAQRDFLRQLTGPSPDARQQRMLRRLRPLADRTLTGDVTTAVRCGIAADGDTTEE